MTTPLNNKKGTTLVELMVCLVLLALFGVAAVTLAKPSAEAYISVQQLTRAQNLADALTETIRGELANADGTLAIVDAATDYSTRNTVFAKDQRLTQGTALRFTATSNYVEVLDAGYVPRLYSSKSQTDNKKKDVYIPPAQSGASDSAVYPELQGYLHMRFYEFNTDGTVKYERTSEGGSDKLDCAYAYTTAYPNGDYMGLVISKLKFYARGWEKDAATGKVHLTSLTLQLTVADPATNTDIYTQTAVIPLPGSPEFN